MRRDIQGLRCLAVVAVVLFHIWPQSFRNGYLGVDIFFVISGYLMCMLMSRRPLGAATVSDFYFRRLRRIVPQYLLILALIVVSATYFMAPSELYSVIQKGFYSSTFLSNIFGLPTRGYFGVSTSFDLFLHTWSLSVELQFYLVVPLIFYIICGLKHHGNTADLIFIGLIGTVSCYLQFHFDDDQNIAHMAFYCRIWQFLCGFVAFRIYSSFKTSNSTRSSLKFTIASSILLFVLAFALALDMINNKQCSRLFITVVATILIAVPTENELLSLRPIVHIGDISYSIYLIHWPLIKIVHYTHYERYRASEGLPLDVLVISQLLICYIASYAVETLFHYVTPHMKRWTDLIITITVLYTFLLGASSFAYSISSASSDIFRERNITLEELVYNLHQHDEKLWPYNRLETMELNSLMYQEGTFDWSVCKDKRKYLNTKREFDLHFVMWMCHTEGKGTKEVVIFGNSLARDLQYGVSTIFNDVIGNLTVIAAGHCAPYMAKYAQKTPFCSEQCLKHCFDYERQIINILKEWPRPIDIIIVQHSYGEFKRLPYSSNDEPQQVIQNFYSQLENIAREAVILPYGEVWAPYEFTVYMKRLAFADRAISSSDKRQKNGTAIINKRIADIKCRKCIKIDYSRLICRKNGRCNFSSSNGTLYYVDHLHTTMFASLGYAQQIRKRYDEFLIERDRINV